MTPDARRLRTSEGPLVDSYDCAMLDLDGVVYVGEHAVPGVAEVLGQAGAQGMVLAFVTNNAARTPSEVAEHLQSLGVPAQPADVVTSAQAAATSLAGRYPPGAPILVVGGEGLVEALRERGLVPVDSLNAEPVAVAQGFHRSVGWQQLAEAAYAIRGGAGWVASNLDLTIPTARGIAPGNGALINAVAEAAGRRPDVVAGKPFRPLFDETVERTGSTHPLMVGDRLDTDIEGAYNCGADSLLVMTGVTDVTRLCAARGPQRPDFVAFTLDGLLASHQAPTHHQDGWELGGWRVSVAEDALSIEQTGDAPDDGLRCVVSAAWYVEDTDSDAPLDVSAAVTALTPA